MITLIILAHGVIVDIFIGAIKLWWLLMIIL